MINTLLLMLSFILLLVAAFGITLPRVNLGWLGLAMYVLSILLSGMSGVR